MSALNYVPNQVNSQNDIITLQELILLHYINLRKFELSYTKTYSDDLSVYKKKIEEATKATYKSTEVDWFHPGLATWRGMPPAGSSFHAPNETTEAKRGVHHLTDPSCLVPATTRLPERRARP
jgi:hypothetical protein